MDIKSCKGQSPIVRLSMFAGVTHVWSCPSIGFPDGSLEICCTSLLACISPHWNALPNTGPSRQSGQSLYPKQGSEPITTEAIS